MLRVLMCFAKLSTQGSSPFTIKSYYIYYLMMYIKYLGLWVKMQAAIGLHRLFYKG